MKKSLSNSGCSCARERRVGLGAERWLIGIAINEARDRLRQDAPIRISSIDEPQGGEVTLAPAHLCGWRELTSELVGREDIRESLQRAVEMLPGIYQQVFLLRDVEELNVNDTAQVLDLNASFVRAATHGTRMTLQRILAPKLKTMDTAPKKGCLGDGK
jgi:RNA polymerase sigma-70 factor (ECF subfamily)